MNAEDLIELERAGRRCGVCHSGRGWRRFEVIRGADRAPVVLCANCRARFGDDPSTGREPASALDPAPALPEAPRQRKPEAPRQRKPEAPRQLKPEAPRQRKPETARQRAPEIAPQQAPETPPQRKPGAGEGRTEQRPDRLQAALRKLPGSFSTAMAARAAGLNNEKTTARLQDLERRGEVRRVGNRWSTDAPPTDLTEAIDRLEARTSNLRIVRDRTRVG